MTDKVKAPAAATAKGLRGLDQATSKIDPEHNATAAAAQAAEFSATGWKKPNRGGRPKGSKSKKSLDLIEAMYAIAEAAHPITGRGIGYKLFTRRLISSMKLSEMEKVY